MELCESKRVFILSNENATLETNNLYQNLGKLSKNFTLFGHHETTMYGVNWWGEANRSDVKDITGSYPALFSWDIAHVGEPNNINGVSFDDMRTSITSSYELGSVHSFCWHIPNLNTGGDSWDTTPNVHLLIPGGDLHLLYQERLNLLAEYFLSLEAPGGEKIPLIFRPFHEMTGSWFWWGKGNTSVEDYVKLWQFTKTYLEGLGVNQLIWCYSTDVFNDKNQYFEFYPGDDYVDILAFDDYQNVKHNIGRFVIEMESVANWAQQKNKIAGVSETGLERVVQADFWTKNVLRSLQQEKSCQGISFVVAWRNANENHHYIPYPDHPAALDFIMFYQDPQTLFLNNLPNLYE